MAGAETNNNLGISSLGYNIRLQYYFWKKSDGTFIGYQGIVNAIYDGCKVVNCSWYDQISSSSQAPLTPSADVQDVLDLAALNNVTIVAAAGNGWANFVDPSSYFYPASYNGVISVTAVGDQWNVGDQSHLGNWKDCHREFFKPGNGPQTNDSTYEHNDRVDICAPGYYMETTCNIGNGYCEAGGTSLAAPMVSAAAALLYSINPFFTPAQVESYLKNNAANLYNACIINGVSDNNNWAGKLGAGRLDAGASLQAAASNTYNGPAYCSSCPTETTYITNTSQVQPGGNFYNYAIVGGSSNSGYVQPSTTVLTSFVATSSVTLQAGFDANPGNGVYFTAYIQPCTNPGGGRMADETKKALTAESSTAKGLQLYPNPATDEVNVLFTIAKNEKATLEVVNSFGRVVKTKSVFSSMNGSGNATINIKKLSAGVYYISITSISNKITRKLIKMKQ